MSGLITCASGAAIAHKGTLWHSHCRRQNMTDLLGGSNLGSHGQTFSVCLISPPRSACEDRSPAVAIWRHVQAHVTYEYVIVLDAWSRSADTSVRIVTKANPSKDGDAKPPV